MFLKTKNTEDLETLFLIFKVLTLVSCTIQLEM
jgi:hypothetical protein